MLNSFTPNTKIESAKVNANFTNFSDNALWAVKQWIFPSTLSLETGLDYFVLPDNATIQRVNLVVATAPTGAAIIVDIERSTDLSSWTSIFTNQSNRPQIAIGAKTGNTTTIDVPQGTGNTHYYRAVIDQIGSTIAGADLNVFMQCKYDLD